MEKMKNRALSANRTSLSGDDLLQSSSTRPDSARLLEEEQIQGDHSHLFPTGHKVDIHLDGQSIEVHDINGELQVQINITPQGPQIRLNGGQLDLQSPENISMDCNSFRLTTNEDTEIFAKGHVKIDSREEMRITCEDDVFIRAKVIWLN